MTEEQANQVETAVQVETSRRDVSTRTVGQPSGQEQQSTPKVSWLDRVLGRTLPVEGRVPMQDAAQSASEGPKLLQARTVRTEADVESASQAKADDGTGGAEGEPKQSKREYDDEEIARLVQAEVDRREAKRLAEQRKREKQELRKKDPWKYMAMEEQEEQQQASAESAHQLIGVLAGEYDRAVLDPLVMALPESERKAVLEKGSSDGSSGLDGRKTVAQAALDALKKHWMTEGEKKAADRLRKDPAFRKQLLVELRGERQEPDLLQGSNGSPSTDMNTVLRSAFTTRNNKR